MTGAQKTSVGGALFQDDSLTAGRGRVASTNAKMANLRFSSDEDWKRNPPAPVPKKRRARGLFVQSKTGGGVVAGSPTGGAPMDDSFQDFTPMDAEGVTSPQALGGQHTGLLGSGLSPIGQTSASHGLSKPNKERKN